MRERDPAEHFVAMPELGRFGAQEFLARRSIEVQIGNGNGGTRRRAAGSGSALSPRIA
jgi:hypothetical protein